MATETHKRQTSRATLRPEFLRTRFEEGTTSIFSRVRSRKGGSKSVEWGNSTSSSTSSSSSSSLGSSSSSRTCQSDSPSRKGFKIPFQRGASIKSPANSLRLHLTLLPIRLRSFVREATVMPMHLRFGKAKLKTPAELVAKILSATSHFSDPKERTKEKALEDVGRYLEQLKVHVFGNEEHSLQKDNVLVVATAAAEGGLFLNLCMHLGEMEFESRKDAAQVFGALLRIKDDNDKAPMADYVKKHPSILEMLFNGYEHTEDPHMGLNCGSMLRDCIRHEDLAREVLDSPMFLRFFEEIEEKKFEIAADAFATFKDLITRHKELVAGFLETKFDEFFPRYNKLLKSDNFFTKRQLLKLLGELLMDSANVRVMVKYVADVHNLILMMNLLRDQYDSIQYEAFHVFKVFVANPSKPPAVVEILKNNKGKLLKYLENFHKERAADDEQFQDEKNFIVKEISLIDTEA